MRIVLFVMLLITNALANNVSGDLPLAVKTFYQVYQVYLEVKSSGVPTEKERARFAPHLSAQLQELLRGAPGAGYSPCPTGSAENPAFFSNSLKEA